MNREIKFRAWVKEQDRIKKYVGMFYGVERAYDTLGSMLDSQGKERDYAWQSFYEVLGDAKKGELVLMQYTGLKDKNGREIYEGDIVNYTLCTGKKDTAEVEWTNWGTGFEPFTVCGKCGDVPDIERVVVIGNIYENPELLKHDKNS